MISWVVERLVDLIGPIREANKDKRELKDTALRAISDAIHETYLYYRDLDNGKPVDSSREGQLVRLWAAAAIPIRHFDSELASTCQYKAQYWLDPKNWQSKKIAAVNIKLDRIRKAYAEMLTT